MFHRIISILFIIVTTTFVTVTSHASNNTPYVAIINYGPHSSLHETIDGIKDGLLEHGFKHGETATITVEDVNFDSALIAQMVTKTKANTPDLIIAMSTPVAQMTKNMVKNIPVLFTAVTDPVEAKLLKKATEPNGNISGTSDAQSVKYVLSMTKKLLPKSDIFGMLYSTAEANDAALLKMMQQESAKHKLSLIAIPVDQMRDIPSRMRQFNKLADFIYVGTSGPIQPALPTISATARKMNIPIINADPEAVKQHQALASFGVRYYRIGLQTANMAARILRGKNISNIKPQAPSYAEHHAFISKQQMQQFSMQSPHDITNITIIE